MLRLITRSTVSQHLACNNTIKFLPSFTQNSQQLLLKDNEAVISMQQKRYVSSTTDSSFISSIWQSLSNSVPVEYMQHTLITIHDYSGLPWWASIIMSTVVFRTAITLPLTVYQYKITARLETITHEMPPIVKELKKEAVMAMKKFNWTEQHTKIVYNRSIRKQWNKLVVRENCHPAKTLIVLWGQIPLWICQSVALRNIVQMLPDPNSLQAQVAFTELTIGGFGWIPNLTQVDSSYILPVALGLINLSIIQVQSHLRNKPPGRLQKYATNAFKLFSIGMVPIACTVPSALCLYWVASSSYGLTQNLLLLSPKIRRGFGIPQTENEIQNPYERLWKMITLKKDVQIVTPTKEPKIDLNSDLQQNDEDSKEQPKNKTKEHRLK
ncbi:cytochrome c oxidase assembly protein COX18, mitochondrial [Teleopsis dalmanni]|uniref:cytochrome c oxidase assembly protein COX18, mitochondrial n=1 Tax=Teleopsis dalmanni TaxID=139649 RepID=UPI0018CE8CE6|nr:cytochrome c oxidase assembly protein COX18, mitochondrial [Teleopsis dalmanni]